ncbi:MAG: proliferating cell nuclear antigen (pcna) [Candidatus Bathyarchaeia archaeon]
MIKAVLSNAKIWKNILDAVSTLIDEADFNFDENGIKLRSMDPSHVAMVDLDWQKSAFEDYSCSKPTKARISIKGMLKLLKRVKSDENLEIVFDDETKKINLTLKGKITKKFVIPTLEPGGEEAPTPKLTFDSKIKILSRTLKEVLDDIQAVSDNVKLETTMEKFVLQAIGELSSATIEIEKGNESLLELDVKAPSKAAFNLSYLTEIVKAGASTSDLLSLEFSTNKPIKLEFELPGQGKLSYYLAPRIESE